MGCPCENQQSRQAADGSPAAIIDGSLARRFVIQDFCPLAESLDWQLGQLYWNARGAQAFFSGDVPFLINNDGNLSVSAASLLFSNLAAAERQGRLDGEIFVLELGVGIGLFARLFLDAFRDLCLEFGRDYYHRLCFIATDSSSSMLEDLARHRLLESHAGRCQVRLLDALDPVAGPARFHAVFLNYLLDNLPAAVLRFDQTCVLQLCVRTCLARNLELKNYTSLGPEELAGRAASPRLEDRQTLVGLYPLFSLDFDYRPAQRSFPGAEFAARVASPGQPVLLNYGAIQCLERLLTGLAPDGFILVNDFPSYRAESHNDVRHQRFGGSTAVGVDFSLLKGYFTGSGCVWLEPAEDHGNISTRLLAARVDETCSGRFAQLFGKAAFEWAAAPAVAARGHAKEGRHEAALVAYREALARQPRNWALLGEAAGFLTYTLQDHEAALAMVRRALDLNPIGPGLWNTLGDCLFSLDRVEEAHQAFLHALELHPDDVPARYNLVYTLVRRNDLAAALAMVAEALALDKAGDYRDRLLARQSEILRRGDQLQQRRLYYLNNRFPASTEPHP